jgi:hypothetical protein
VNSIDPGGGASCPADAKGFSGAEAKYNCVAIVQNVTGRDIWIRQGTSNGSFGISHAAKHGIDLQATEVALRHARLTASPVAFTGGLEFVEDLPIKGGPDAGLPLYTAVFYVQTRDRVAPNSNQVAPDHHQIGLLTSFCRGYGGIQLPNKGTCPGGTSSSIINNQNPSNL